MRITGTTLVRFEAGLARPAESAIAAWDRRGGVLLELRDEDGRVGQGEASPLPGYSPDDIEGSERALAELGGRLGEITDDEPAAASVQRALGPVAGARAASPAARFAIETALLDLLGQRRGCSVAELLAGGRPSYASVARSGLLGPAATADLVTAARAAEQRGIRTVKVKVGASGAFDRELEALARLRAAVPGVTLRLDANGAWPAAVARDHLRRLAPLEPEWIEEPARGADLLELGRADVGWAADESLRLPGAARLISSAGCVAVVLKPALLGGLLAARALGEAALAIGRAVVVTHLFDGPVGLAAACELCLSFSLPPAASGLDLHAGLGAWPAVTIPQLAADPAVVVASGRAGLGLTRIAEHTRAPARGGL